MRYRYGKFFADWRDQNGTRRRRGFLTQREAKQYQQKMREEIRFLKRDSSQGRVGDLCVAWLETRKHFNDRRAAAAMKELAGNLQVRELNGAVSRIIVENWKKTCGSPHTIWNYRYALRRLIKYLLANGAPQELLVELPRVPEPQHRDVTFNEEEKQAMFDTCRPPNFAPWFRCLILIGFTLGLRRKEAMRLAPCHYDPVSREFRSLPIKNNRRHGLPVEGELREIFEAVQVPEGQEKCPYVQLIRGKAVTPQAVCWWWKKLKKAAGVRMNLTFHDERRTSAMDILDRTGDVALVRDFLGHKSFAATEAYIASARPEALRGVLREMTIPFRKLPFPARKKGV